nr:hypothetical protein [Tanacetum cinerariifolium]
MFIELIRKNDDSSEGEPEEEGSTPTKEKSLTTTATLLHLTPASPPSTQNTKNLAFLKFLGKKHENGYLTNTRVRSDTRQKKKNEGLEDALGRRDDQGQRAHKKSVRENKAVDGQRNIVSVRTKENMSYRAERRGNGSVQSEKCTKEEEMDEKFRSCSVDNPLNDKFPTANGIATIVTNREALREY